jgi:preprotein translocase subunit Sec63
LAAHSCLAKTALEDGDSMRHIIFTRSEHRAWNTLGLPRFPSLKEPRAHYKTLSLSLHSDKTHGDSVEERARKEELFKAVGVAFHLLEEKLKLNPIVVED